jgi:hypothetical protein
MIELFNSFERYAKFLFDKELDAHEFLLLMILYKKNYNLLEEFKSKYSITLFPDKSVDQVNAQIIDGLVNKGFLLDFNEVKNGKKYYLAENFVVTDKFTEGLLIPDLDDAASKLFKLFPLFCIFKGNKRPARNVGLDELPDLLHKVIGDSQEEYDTIIRKLTAYKKRHPNGISCTLRTFLLKRWWDLLPEPGEETDDDDERKTGDIGIRNV